MSIIYHGLAVAVALSMPRLAVPVPEALFRWDVAIREAAAPDPVVHPSTNSQVEPRAETPPPVQAVHANQSSVRQVQQEVRQVVQRYVRVATTFPQPIARAVESSVVSSQTVQASVVQNPTAVVREPSGLLSREVVGTAPAVAVSTAVDRAGEVKDASSLVTARAMVEAQLSSDSAGQPAGLIRHPDHQAVEADDVQAKEQTNIQTRVVLATPRARAHYGWLKESLTERIEQMKRYPDIAAEHRWEGRVVVRGVIKADGEIFDLIVVESSGFQVLDDEALSLLRRISPFTLKHPLGQPEVTLRIPISYGIR